MDPVRDMNYSIASITVTYFPDLDVLSDQLEALPPYCFRIIVDNSADAVVRARLSAFVGDSGSTALVFRNYNGGLASGINQGVAVAVQKKLELVLLLDQDTVPAPDSVAVLIDRWEVLRRTGCKVGAVGPRLIDPVSSVDHGFHATKGIFWVRIYPSFDSGPVVVRSVNGSGTLMATSDFLLCGGLRESLFIDHVDTEWSFRLQAAGFTLYGVPDVMFYHRMGEVTKRVWLLGWRVWPQRSPERQYYLYRNTVRLITLSHVPVVWKSWAVLKLMGAFAVTMIVDTRRFEQARKMIQGVRDAFVETLAT